MKRTLAVVMLVLLYATDQASKWWVSTRMHEGQRIPVVDGLLWWQYLRNPGAAFSLGESVTWVFTLVLAAAAVVLLVLVPRARTGAWIFSLCGLLAGVLGNLTDRLLREPGFGRGHVVDFIAVPHFAVFNVADSCICVSILSIALLSFRGVPLAGTAPEHPAGAPDQDAGTVQEDGPGAARHEVVPQTAHEDGSTR